MVFKNVFLVFLISCLFLPGNVLSSPKVKQTKSAVNLDAKHSVAYWHVLTNTEIGEEELIGSFCKPPFTDEFDKRRQLKSAMAEYAKCKIDVTGLDSFVVELPEKIGDYDFKAKVFPLYLYEGGKDHVSAAGGTVWYKIFEDMRMVEASESFAEKIMPRINERQHIVSMQLEMKVISAEANEDKTIVAEIKKFTVKIPAGGHVDPWSGLVGKKIIVDPQKKEIVLKTWVPGKSKWSYGGPNIEGVWKGTEQVPEQEAGGVVTEGPGKVEYVLNIEQSRAILSGTSHVVKFGGANPLGNVSSPQATDGKITGTIGSDGLISIQMDHVLKDDYSGDDFRLQGHLIGSVLSGENFQLSRSEDSKSE